MGTLDAATAKALAECNGFLTFRDSVTTLDADKTLGAFDGNYLYLDGVTALASVERALLAHLAP